jgi:hypothetical protein
MIQIMTFAEFESKFSIDVSDLTAKELERSVELYMSVFKGEVVNGKVLTRVVRNNELEKELKDLSKAYDALGDHIIVYKKLAVKEASSTNIYWSYYKIVLFNTLDTFKIKKLLKINKLKAFS